MRLRNRQVKAEFWTDPDLLQLPRDMRVFYQGLWHCAEDSGCLEDSPFALKLLLFPSPVDSDITVELIGNWIETFIDMSKLMRYEVRGKSYLFLTNFHKHQTLRNPGVSEVPLAPWVRWEQSQDADGKRLSGKYVVLDLDETDSGLVEDATNLVPGSYQSGTESVLSSYEPGNHSKVREGKVSREKVIDTPSDDGQSAVADDEPEISPQEFCQQVIDFYNEQFKGLWKRPLQLTNDRKAKIKARRKRFTLEQLRQAIVNIRASPFHCGENDRGVVYATPEFIFRNDGMVDKWLNMEVHGNGRSGAATENPHRGKYDELVLR